MKSYENNLRKKSAFSMLSVFILVVLTMSMVAALLVAAVGQPMITTVSAETNTVTNIAELSSQVGCVDDAVIVMSGEDESIKMDATADSGNIDLDDFTTMDASFYIYFYGTKCTLQVTIEDEDDSSNYIEITFTCDSSAKISVTVKDHTSTGSSDEEGATSDVDAYQDWALVDIDIFTSPASTDGTAKMLSLEVGGEKVIEDYPLATYEWKGKLKERKFTTLTVSPTVLHDSGDYINIDKFTTDTGNEGYGGWNLVPILFLVLLLIVALAQWRYKVMTKTYDKVRAKLK